MTLAHAEAARNTRTAAEKTADMINPGVLHNNLYKGGMNHELD